MVEAKYFPTRAPRIADLAEVRNPILSLPHLPAIRRLHPDARRALAEVLQDLRLDAAARAEAAWKARKAPMACYWRAVSVYAGHIARAVA